MSFFSSVKKTLEKDKYLEKGEDKQNKSKNIIKLTQKGLKEYGKAKKIIEKELDKIFKVVDTRDRKKILTNFDKIISKLLESK
jgi:DNA-binding MarR family transcriptional regulator